jgi:hypothetical protein
MEIARRAEQALRSDRTYLEAKMTVKAPGLPGPRVVAFRSWHDRVRDRSLIRILAPAKDAGTTFLYLPPNLWMHAPRGERTERIATAEMLGSWLGSDFTYDDLVHGASEVGDYDPRLLRIEEGAEGLEGLRAYVLEFLPLAEAPATWARILAWVEVEHATPLRRDFYDAEGVQVRSLRFQDIREVEGRRVPHRWIMSPLVKQGYETRIELESIDFDASFDDDVFTTRQLKER